MFLWMLVLSLKSSDCRHLSDSSLCFQIQKKNQEKLFKPFLQTGRLDCWVFFGTENIFFLSQNMTKYCQTASAGVWPCLLKSGLLKKLKSRPCGV